MTEYTLTQEQISQGFRIEDDYLYDKDNNLWDLQDTTLEEAIEYSKTLENCKNCEECKNCKNCEGCMNCEGCEDCIDCYKCRNCENCEKCVWCDNCTDLKEYVADGVVMILTIGVYDE